MEEIVKAQILAIRDSGLTNMLDFKTVQYLAFDRGYYELVLYIEDNRSKYFSFIICGEEENS